MFEKLQCLPLLMGLSINDLMDIVEQVKFEFKKYQEGDIIASQGDKCDKIIYVLNGDLCALKRDTRREFMICEYFNKLYYIIEPQNVWGMNQRYERTYSFTSDGSTCVIDKQQMNFLLSRYEIIKTNFISLICSRIQSATYILSQSIPNSTEQRIVFFMKNNKVFLKGRTEIKVKMQKLANIVSDTRLNVSKVLNLWQNNGLAHIKRGVVIIPDDTKLFD